MKRKIIISGVIIVVCLLLILIVHSIKEGLREKQIREATIIVDLKEDLTVPFLTETKLSDFITNINGTINGDFKIETDKLGEKEIKFKYVNDENIEIPYSFKINVVDITAPIIWLGKSYTITTDFKGKLEDQIMCVDDIDDNPTCKIEGEYDTKKEGSYELNYIAKDASGNEKIWPFTLNVKKPSSGGGTSNTKRILFEDAVKNYKNENTKIGIDVSVWQGDIDFEKVKNAGVEFAIIRVGSKRGSGGEYFVDSKFKRNIEGFNKVGVPVGLYFYSYAKSKDEAKRDALWLIDQIKDYKVDLPIAYDWENWGTYNSFHLSRYSLTENAKAFLETIEKNGYKAMHYSSKNYLESIWYNTGYPTWLAHYTSKTNYRGDYIFWQFCNIGKVDGINGNVDLDVMYLKEGSN